MENTFLKYGYTQKEIDKRVADTFTEIFERFICPKVQKSYRQFYQVSHSLLSLLHHLYLVPLISTTHPFRSHWPSLCSKK